MTEQEAPQLYAMVEDLARRRDMPMPRLYISPEPQPNAFATGRSPNHAAVCVTQGILQVLDQDELRGVLAHEMAHVQQPRHPHRLGRRRGRDGDHVRRRAWRCGARCSAVADDDDDGGNIIGVLAMVILAPHRGRCSSRWRFCRSREFEADATGAKLLGDGEPLARALEKIEAYAKQVPMNVDPAQATAYIINPLTGRKISFAGLFPTHPPTAERVARLRAEEWR